MSSFNLGKTKVTFQYIYVAVLVTVLVLDKNGGIFCCFLASFFHEIGHLIALICLKQRVDEVRFTVFDIQIRSSHYLDFKREIIITLSGVAFNFLLSIFFYRIIPLFSLANLFIGIFNILPVSTLDGGQAINLFFCRFISPKKSVIIINVLTVIVSIPIFTFGIIILLNTKYNFSFLLLGVYLILTVVNNKEIIL